ncbi:MAG TPA: hypothetical protein PLZ57_00005 [Pseudobdellovibrionaceae bacterium]|nr:hypothetical protein [Pseudobdellovibrionaceae bacterium]
MRICLLVLLSCLIELSTIPAHANNLRGSQAPEIHSSTVAPELLERLRERCANRGFMNTPLHSSLDDCRKAVEDPHFSAPALEYCLAKRTYTEMRGCLTIIRGRDFPVQYLQACERAGHRGAQAYQDCLSFLANSSSTYDQEAFQLCLERGMVARFREAVGCLNAIRDRQVNTQSLRRLCVTELSSMGDNFADCVNRTAETFPLSPYCAPPTSGGASVGAPARPRSPTRSTP